MGNGKVAAIVAERAGKGGSASEGARRTLRRARTVALRKGSALVVFRGPMAPYTATVTRDGRCKSGVRLVFK